MSTIDPTLPVQGEPYSAAPIRANFQAAIADLVALENMNAGASAPSTPVLGTLWLNTSQGTTYTLEIWNDRLSQWVVIASLDSLHSLWVPPVGGGLPVSLLADDTTDLGSVPQTVITITGGGPIFSFGSTAPAGIVKVLEFTGATNLTYNATSMILPGAADINTVDGDMAIAVALGAGDWKILFFQSSQLSVQQGGTGRSTLTAHAALIGAGTAPINFAVPSTKGDVLQSTGATTDPAFLPVDASTVTGTVTVGHGGTGLSAVTIHNLLVGNGTNALTLLPPATLGLPLLAQGASLNPAYGKLDLSIGATGTLGPGHGGFDTVPVHNLIVGNATVTPTFLPPSATIGLPLLSAGAAVDPAYGTLPPTAITPIADKTVVGNVSGGVAAPIALSTTQLTTLVDQFTTGLSGAVPASGGGTTNFLRADGTFAAPSVGLTASLNMRLFTNSGAIVIPAANAMVTIIGGGGGGGAGKSDAANPTGGGGGGSGAVICYPLSGLTVGNTIMLTVGTAGAGAVVDGTAGGNGGDTILASGTETISTITAGGGLGADAAQNGGAGGAASGGGGNSVNINGTTGEDGFTAPTTGVTGSGGTISGLIGNYGYGGTGGIGFVGSFRDGLDGIVGACLYVWIA